ncbi:MAG: polyprenyl synthetase family protein [Proteobacteria bacterium]|nr:polyprenyl synthetase family protein [Pseudomonadota bacterium]
MKSTGRASTLQSVAASLAGFDSVEQLIRSKFSSEASLLQEISEYLFSVGGKRIRPIMTLMTGALFGLTPPSRELCEVAAGIELIHMATLLHDDIIDKSPLRRHKPSPFAAYGTEATLLAGDFLLTRAFSLCAHLENFIIDRTEEACVALTEGEILETPLWKEIHSIESSLNIAKKKTAALFWLGGQCGARLAGAGEEATLAMAAFGNAMGTAFQILDDILDVTSSDEVLGKPAGLDLIERKPSVVNVLWLQSGSALAQNLRAPPSADEERFRSEALQELRGSTIISEARRLAESFADTAKTELQRALDAAPRVDRQMEAQFRGLIEYTLARLS